MAIDPSISLGVRIPQIAIPQFPIQSPLDKFQKIMSLRNLMAQGQLSQLNLEQTALENRKLQQDFQDEQAARALYAGGNEPTSAELFSKVGPRTGLTIQKLQQDFAKARLDKQIADLEFAGKQTERMAHLALGVKGRPDQWGPTILQATSEKVLTPEVGRQLMESGYDEKALDGFIAQSLTALQEHQIRIAAAKEKRDKLMFDPQLQEVTDKAAAGRRVANASRLAAILRTQGPTAYNAAVSQLPEAERQPFMGLMAEKDVLNVGRTPQEISQSLQANRPQQFEDYVAITKDENEHPSRRKWAQSVADAIQESRVAVAEARQQLTSAGGITAPQRQAILQISGQFDNEPIVKRFNTITQGYNFVRSLAPGGKSNPAEDIAIIYAFAKAMDPESVVREGEYATVQKYIQSWLSTYGFNAARILAGTEFLTETARQQIKGTVEKTATSARQQYDNVYKEYGRRMEALSGVPNATRFLTNYGAAFEQPPALPNSGGGNRPPLSSFER